MPKQQTEAMQQGIRTEEYGIKIVRHTICKSNKFLSSTNILAILYESVFNSAFTI